MINKITKLVHLLHKHSPEQAAEQERQQEISSFGLDAGSSE